MLRIATHRTAPTRPATLARSATGRTSWLSLGQAPGCASVTRRLPSRVPTMKTAAEANLRRGPMMKIIVRDPSAAFLVARKSQCIRAGRPSRPSTRALEHATPDLIPPRPGRSTRADTSLSCLSHFQSITAHRLNQRRKAPLPRRAGVADTHVADQGLGPRGLTKHTRVRR